jgi:outer membrane protein assembly factor BamB
MSEIEYTGNEITIEGTTHELRHQIGDVIDDTDVIIIRLSPESGEYDKQNVLAFDRNGQKLWESEVPQKGSQHTFLGISKQNDKIVGRSWNNHRYQIDPETGELEDLGYSGK